MLIYRKKIFQGIITHIAYWKSNKYFIVPEQSLRSEFQKEKL